MGMFDSVMVPCPNCGRKCEFQSKAWHCDLDVYSLDDAPSEVAWDILNDPHFCHGCRRWFALVDPSLPPGQPRPKPNVQALLLKPRPETTEQLNSGQYFWPWDEQFTFDHLEQPPQPLPPCSACRCSGSARLCAAPPTSGDNP